MIYHLDTVLNNVDTTGHATAMMYAMQRYYKGNIQVYPILDANKKINVNVILESLEEISNTATKYDVVSFNFLLTYNVNILCKRLLQLAKTTNLVAAAGNNSSSIENFCPINVLDANCIVGCLNKTGLPAASSNYGNVGIWVTGTNQEVKIQKNTCIVSGTSISAAYYAGYRAGELEDSALQLSDIEILINT